MVWFYFSFMGPPCPHPHILPPIQHQYPVLTVSAVAASGVPRAAKVSFINPPSTTYPQPHGWPLRFTQKSTLVCLVLSFHMRGPLYWETWYKFPHLPTWRELQSSKWVSSPEHSRLWTRHYLPALLPPSYPPAFLSHFLFSTGVKQPCFPICAYAYIWRPDVSPKTPLCVFQKI